MGNIRFPITYWGSISYYQELCRLQSVCLEIYETYPKQTLRNRTTILTANGILDLSIPVVKPNGSKSVTELVQVDDSQAWRKTHWRTLTAAYASSPYFDHYAKDIEQLLFQDEQNLVRFNVRLIHFLIAHLALPVELSLSTKFDKKVTLHYLKHLEQQQTTVIYSYQQVFQSSNNFIPNLSILDALFNLGPMARNIIVGKI